MKHKSVKQHEFFKVNKGQVERIRKQCPRCGEGVWLAAHKTRLYCGKCKYTEFLNA